MTQIRYDIQTKAFNTFTVEFNSGNPNNFTVGETASFTFEFPTFHNDLTISTDTTLGGVNGYGVVTVESGATLTLPDGALLQATQVTGGGTVTGAGAIQITGDLDAAFNEYMQWAGSWATLEMLNNVVKYRMQFPDSAAIDSLVWGITPNTELADRNVVGVWGLVENIDNERNQSLTTNRYSVDVTVLAPINDYATISDVETELVI
jgi:hypothetical protein